MGFWGKIKQAVGGPAAIATRPATAPLLREELFRAEVRQLAETCAYISSLRDDPESPLVLRATTAGGELTLTPGNLFAEPREDGPEARAGKIARFLSSLDRVAEPLSWEDARERL